MEKLKNLFKSDSNSNEMVKKYKSNIYDSAFFHFQRIFERNELDGTSSIIKALEYMLAGIKQLVIEHTNYVYNFQYAEKVKCNFNKKSMFNQIFFQRNFLKCFLKSFFLKNLKKCRRNSFYWLLVQLSTLHVYIKHGNYIMMIRLLNIDGFLTVLDLLIMKLLIG
jgi:hypothetical protein